MFTQYILHGCFTNNKTEISKGTRKTIIKEKAHPINDTKIV